MNKCTVIHMRDMKFGDIYGGRPTWLGNPYLIGRDGTRDEVCDKFIALRKDDTEFIDKIKRELAGKRIVCWCKPQRCHLDWVAAVVNGEIKC